MLLTKMIYNIAHRGARSLAPENTMPAFIKAWEVGAHGVETDVSVTSDGQLILFHDSSLLRTTNVAQIFPERQDDQLHTFTLREIQSLDAGSWFIEADPYGMIENGTVSLKEQKAIQNITVPFLEELLQFVKEKSLYVNIEIKPLPQEKSTFPVVARVLSLIEHHKLTPNMFSISSFHHSYLRQVKQLRPDVEVNALIGKNEFIKQDWGEYEFEIYNARGTLTDSSQIEKAFQHGCSINLYAVDDIEDMKHFLKAGVKKIITDFPQLLAQMHL